MSDRTPNPFIPMRSVVEEVIEESPDVRTLVLGLEKEIEFTPGQFVMVSVPGYGEAPFAIASPPGRCRRIEVSVRRVGDVTAAIHRLRRGDEVGVRGPFGRGFPIKELENRDIVVVAGGTGLLGVSSLLWYMHMNRGVFGEVYLLYGARTPRDLLKRRHLEEWSRSMKLLLSVDRVDGGEWRGHVGFVTDLLDKIERARDEVYILCGPPMMMKVAYRKLVSRGVPPSSIYVSLERHMKCGLGICGRCMLSNGLYVCRDGPVFRCDEIPEREIE